MRKFLLVALLAMMCLLVSGVAAQDSTTFCGDLSADDCAVLQASEAAMAGLSSATADFTLNLTMAGIPDAPGDISLDLTGDATWSADADALAGLSDMSAADMQDPTKALEAAGKAIAAVNAELNLSLTIPQELAAGGGLPFSNLDLQLRLVEGVGYINFDTLAPLLAGTPQAEMLTGWGGLDLTEALAQLGPMLTGQMGAMGEMPSTDTTEMSDEMMEGLTITREADADGAAVFVTTFDSAALMSNPMFAEQLRSQLQAQGQTMTDEEFDALISALSENPDAFTLTATQSIDLETNFVRSAGFELNLDLAAFSAMAGEDSAAAAEQLAGSTMSVTGQVNYDNYNSAPEVTAPEGANVITMEQFFNFLFTGELTPQS